MRRDFTQLTAFALLAVSMSVCAQKATIYSDQSITIYADKAGLWFFPSQKLG